MRSAVRSWISTFLNFVNNAENISVLISPGKRMPVQNLTPVMWGIIIVPHVWMICFFAEIVVDTREEEDVSHLKIIFVKNVVVDDAMSNFKSQSSNEAQIPNRRIFDIELFVIHLAFGF